jgi:hypothetical protein
MCTKTFCVLAFAGVAAMGPRLDQDDAATENAPYRLCVAGIEKTPLEAYSTCKQYLEQTSHDDFARIQYVKTWIASYEKVLPYLQFLQGLKADKNAAWFVYEPDMDIQLPQTSDTEGPFRVQIFRSFRDSNEEQMLRKAEAVYPSPSNMVTDVFRSLAYWASKPPEEMAPLWGMPGNDRIQSTIVVTARAVRYYYDLSLTAKVNPQLPTGVKAVSIGLKYDGLIKHFDRYSHSGNIFENVYVSDLTLEWSFTCGGLCGMGFTRNKLVVLDANGNVIAMYLDAPGNSESWVS